MQYQVKSICTENLPWLSIIISLKVAEEWVTHLEIINWNAYICRDPCEAVIIRNFFWHSKGSSRLCKFSFVHNLCLSLSNLWMISKLWARSISMSFYAMFSCLRAQVINLLFALDNFGFGLTITKVFPNSRGW